MNYIQKSPSDLIFLNEFIPMFKVQKYINNIKLKNFWVHNYYIISIFNIFVKAFKHVFVLN